MFLYNFELVKEMEPKCRSLGTFRGHCIYAQYGNCGKRVLTQRRDSRTQPSKYARSLRIMHTCSTMCMIIYPAHFKYLTGPWVISIFNETCVGRVDERQLVGRVDIYTDPTGHDALTVNSNFDASRSPCLILILQLYT